MDIRKLLQFLAGQQSTPTKAVCSECALASFFGPVVSRTACGLCRVAVGRLGAEASTRGPPCRWGRRACVTPGAGARGGPGFRVETCVEALTAPPPPGIVGDKVLHLDVLHEDVSLQYFIPALS